MSIGLEMIDIAQLSLLRLSIVLTSMRALSIVILKTFNYPLDMNKTAYERREDGETPTMLLFTERVDQTSIKREVLMGERERERAREKREQTKERC